MHEMPQDRGMSISKYAEAAAHEMIRIFGAEALNEAARRSDAAARSGDDRTRFAWLTVCAAIEAATGGVGGPEDMLH